MGSQRFSSSSQPLQFSNVKEGNTMPGFIICT